MKNFNLISPKGNGSEYTVRFKDPIVIGKNSQIEFKFAELERAGEVVFQEDQTITITVDPSNVLPRLDPTDGTSPNNLFTDDLDSEGVSIKAGVYSYNELLNQLSTALGQSGGLTTRLNLYEGISVNTDLSQDTQRDIGFGIQYGGTYNNSKENPAIVPLFSNNIQTGTFLSNGEIVKTGGVASTLDGGAMLLNKYVHRYMIDVSNPIPANENQNYILLKGVKTCTNQTGEIHFGLYGAEVSETLGTGTNRLFANGTTAINPLNSDGANGGSTSGNEYLPVYVGMKVGKYGGVIQIYEGRKGTGAMTSSDAIYSWANSTQNIESVRVVKTLRVNDLFNETDNPYFIFQTYQTSRTNPYGHIFYRVIVLTSDPSSNSGYNQKIIYDSRPMNRFLPTTLEVGDLTYGDAPNAIAKAKSQVPFNPVICATDADNGFQIRYPQCRISDVAVQADSIILDYSLTLSDELANALNVAPVSGTLSNMRPYFTLPADYYTRFLTFNAVNDGKFLHVSNIANPWKRDSYAIFIDLPCNNYKNLSSKLNGGFRKSVLANIPAPFASGDIIPADNSNNNIVAVYEPYQSVKSDLLNNEISVNSFKITILDMKTELLAKQLSSSTVNFSILCSDCAEKNK
jgi:hypothetical protein